MDALSLPALDPAVAFALRLAGAALLLSSAVAKLGDRVAFRQALAGYRIVPERLVARAADALVGVELLVGVALLVSPFPTAPALAAVALLGLYTAAIATNLARGLRDIDCGCGGPARRTLGVDLIARNAVLMAALGAIALPVSSRDLVWVDAVTCLGAVGVLALLYVAEETLAANRTTPHVGRVTP